MIDINKIIESLSPYERKILPYLEENSIDLIYKKTGLDEISITRALTFLENKGIVKLSHEKKKIVDVGINGALYRKKGLPERRLLDILGEKKTIVLGEAQKLSALSEDELKASIGALKKKSLIEVKEDKIILTATKQEIAKKSLEESFLESLPLELSSLKPEQLHALKSLENRRNMLEILEEKEIIIDVTDLGKKIIKLKPTEEDRIEQLTPEIIKNESWKGKKFRRYDITSKVPAIYGGKRHFVNQTSN